MKLRDKLPREAMIEWDKGDAFWKHLDVEVLEDRRSRWPGTHKHVFVLKANG